MWQPIETAPESRKEYIVYSPTQKPNVFCALFLDYLGIKSWKRSSSGDYAPRDDFSGDGDLGVTHWMPLPEPPKENP